MQITTKAIVLSSLKYGDSSLISRAFTYTSGLKSYLLKGILAAKKSRIKPAYFQPMMQLEVVANHKNKGTLESLREVKVHYHYVTVHTDIVKNTVSLFLAEMLGNSIREEECNEGLYNFMEASFQWLDTHSQIANFHIFFLLGLTKYLGFYPDTTNTNAPYFSLAEGSFVNVAPGDPYISGITLNFFKRFLGINFDAIHTIHMNKTERQDLLQTLVLYFELHLHGFRKPRSLAILNEVFS